MNRRRLSRLFAVWLSVAAAAAFGCAGTGPYVWVHDLPSSRLASSYVIGVGDLLDVRVYKDDSMSARARVREDGKITLSLIGEIVAAGHTPPDLARDIATRLRNFVNAPIVTVAVEERHPVNVSVLGEVTRPGVFPVTSGAGVLQALALAGGLTEFADRDEIFVIRKNPPLRVRFTYDALTRNDSRAAAFVLANGDAVTVE